MTYTPNNAAAARSIIVQEGTRHTLVIYFTKRTDGARRRMVCRFFPAQADAARYRFNPSERDLLPVWDVERGGPRFVSLDAVDVVKVLAPTSRPAPQPAPDRDAQRRRFEALRAELADFC